MNDTESTLDSLATRAREIIANGAPYVGLADTLAAAKAMNRHGQWASWAPAATGRSLRWVQRQMTEAPIAEKRSNVGAQVLGLMGDASMLMASDASLEDRFAMMIGIENMLKDAYQKWWQQYCDASDEDRARWIAWVDRVHPGIGTQNIDSQHPTTASGVDV